jgi:polyhydroxybutyrate depolymerase
MKKYSSFPVVKGLFASLTLLVATVVNAFADTPEYSIKSAGVERTYKLHIPDNLPDGAPLVIVLHGYGGSNDPGRFGMNETADRHGFAVCYPQGAKDIGGKTGWNVGYPAQHDMKTDDVEFIEQLVRHLQKKHGFSRHNVFCTGMSNGGDMCYQLAAQRPHLFAAVAPVAGLIMDWLYKSDDSTVAVPLFEIHGTADKTTKWYGDPENKDGWGKYLPVPLAVHFWAAKNRCTVMQIDTLAGKAPNCREIIAHRFSGGTGGSEVWLYEIVGGGHSWGAKDIDTGEEVWKFFTRFLKP